MKKLKTILKAILLCGFCLLMLSYPAAADDETAEVHIPVTAYELDCTAELTDDAGRRLRLLKLQKDVPNEFVITCDRLQLYIFHVRLTDKDHGFNYYDHTVYTVYVDLYRGQDGQVCHTVTIAKQTGGTENKTDVIEFHNQRPTFFKILPETGFSASQHRQQERIGQDVHYGITGMTLQIPALSVITDIVTVPRGESNFDVSGLEYHAGLPEGFNLPGEGGTVLTGHDHLSETEAGPFVYLLNMEIGDRIFITDEDNEIRIFEVYANEKIAEDDIDGLENIMDAWDRSVTLMTCEDERPEGGYANRRIVAAKPIGK